MTTKGPRTSVSSTVVGAALILLSAVASAHTIKHIIVLMEENRSFDHMLGWRPGVDGLKPTDCNEVRVGEPKYGKFCVTKNASQVGRCDPDHDLPPTTLKIFGYPAVKAHNFSDPNMCGFIDFENYRGETREKNRFCEVMEMFTPETLPIMNALADEFLLFDKFFASVPGPTWPNRLFVLSATSAGLTETSNPWFRGVTGALYPTRTIYDQVHDAGLTWKNYVNDTPWELFMQTVAENPEHVVLLEEFYRDAREGTLPNFAFINPRAGVNFTYGYGSNDQHPDHDVALGEQYYKEIYEALRASPQWNDTLLILTYDEHGGFYDHVPPPSPVPAPDNYTSWPDKFDFDRGGIRIPTLLISPWIPKGKVEGRPSSPSSKPFSTSEYELTSIMATVRKLLNITEGPLTHRDAWAATFEHLLSEPSPRTDCPMHLPDAVPPTMHQLTYEASLPLNSLQLHMAEVHGQLSGRPLPKHVDRQEHISEWLQTQFAKHKRSVLRRKGLLPKRNRRDGLERELRSAFPFTSDPDYLLQCQPFIGMKNKAASNWTIPEAADLPYRTIYVPIRQDKAATPLNYCMTAEDPRRNASLVGVALCNSTDPLNSTEPSQLWVFTSDATIRPLANQSMCVTNQCTKMSPSTTLSTPVLLLPCTGRLDQRYSYMGPAVGNLGWYDGGMLAQGDAIWSLVVVPKP